MTISNGVAAALAVAALFSLSACQDATPAQTPSSPATTPSSPSPTTKPPGPPPSRMTHMNTQPTEGPTDR